MGLDLHLYRKRYVKNWRHNDDDKYKIRLKKNGKNVPLNNVVYVVEELLYWRKAYAIDNYFVRKCGNGEGDCRPIYVDKIDLIELKKRIDEILSKVKLVKGKISNGYTCNDGKCVENLIDGEVIANKDDLELCRKLLPTLEGYPFGSSTEYHQHYISDLQKTQKMLDELMADPAWEDNDIEYEYMAS